jgi:monoterpene epsilon-lactone hydrolase
MAEFTRFAASPIPAQPSRESVRLRKRMAFNRRMQERARPSGMSLRMNRLIFNTVALTARPPKGGSARWVRYDNGVAGRLVTVRDADPANGILMWVHGGGLVGGTPKIEQLLAADYAAPALMPAFLPRYRLAPENPFPAAADDVLEAYRCLLRQEFPAERIRVGGLSAGGALVAGLLGDIGREGLPMPAAVLLASPLLQLSAEASHRRDEAHPDPVISPNFIERMSRAYAGGTPLTHPRLDYLAADMRGWPPVLVQVGDTECLVAEAELLGAAMRAAGARCEVQLWPGQVHGFMGLGARTVPEARAALDYGGRFLRDAG